ncbi:biotin/lipoyl-containing protein [Sulfobacillus thermosulfidooxidans]|uniref:Biotin-requiring enzyme n=1 Tax=Sulfobacillus thermosulfidooxidans (strain DSM 9293 / VKM B-1269 / AT-1) TaxID=929705 RepID=A0A1W1W772_SULTA|nr:biotin/lipoyl-containing protein [Sulfobacillus thermosulfidooxidans]OLZ09812.1 acetyl-CoA carboxylase biotin carboxyl carrier protein subunit [Sulfobacillus thermosulfidooxidans]OLZ15882.1 acetyl-CoA carboxylase biotin carboxyl carrier protein subunit [Sulfobacillus thermosulfidooxidans]OLZ18271.1 acetyl-CoA carboxylase biotin carboxyl carrier protein subunit [Sulfobacillus thermosulfidooxidans]SMC01593.1 Biotin-requiring enzyme [Sulfobacillus thermosulfidooxidans DSM 9293]
MAVRKFRIRVNGVVYDVEAEEISVEQSATSTSAPSVPSAPVATPPVPSEPPKAAAPVVMQDGEMVIEAPLPGAVLDVKVQEGQLVEVGQVLIILEAMKMENEVTAPVSGRIKSLRVQKGSSVDANEVLVIIERV